jgi:hypothetical protein
MRSTQYPPKPPPEEPKFRYQANIENTAKASDLAERALDSKVTISTGELLALAPDVRRHVKELLASKKISANSIEVDPIDSFLTSCFDSEAPTTRVNFEKYDPAASSAAASLPLRVIFPEFAEDVFPECILDGGAQVVLMRKDVWARLRAPIARSKAMAMESANSGTSHTLGLVEEQPVTIGNVTVRLQIQVVDNAPFEVLLGRPFFDVLSCAEISTAGGNHELRIRDPESGDEFTVPTYPRERRTPPQPTYSAGNFRN